MLKNFIRKNIIYHSYINDIFHSLFKQLKEPIDFIKHFIPKGGVVFDIGANYGQFASYASKLVGKSGHVYCFEPQSYPAMVLKHMVFIRQLKQVMIINSALSTHNGQGNMTIPIEKGWKPKHALAYIGGNQEKTAVFEHVHVKTLDAFWSEEGVKRLDFIKCDVEGSEFNVFSGGLNLLEQFKPYIYCEIEKPHCDRNNIDVSSVFDLLQKIGYESFFSNSDNTLSPVDGYIKRGNYFYVHQSKHQEEITPFKRNLI